MQIKAAGVVLPGDQSGHIVYTHTDANTVGPQELGTGYRGGRGRGTFSEAPEKAAPASQSKTTN